MTMRRGRPRSAESEAEQCVAITEMTEWKRKNHIGPRCPFVAKVLINSKRLCHRHAHIEALSICISNGSATLIPQQVKPSPYAPVKTSEK